MYRIRCRIAAPGTIVTPPDGEHKGSLRRRGQDWAPESKPSWADEESYDEGSQSDTSSDRVNIEYVPGECLFCSWVSEDFDNSLSHMRQIHGLFIPFQSSIAVDLQTLISFLHMLIFSYRECISCGKRRRTVEAVQQHMTSIGHCRFNVTEEINKFYHMDYRDRHPTGRCSHPDDNTLRLPSGKLLGRRSHANPTSKSRLRERSPAGTSDLPASQQSESDTGSRALSRSDQKEQALTARFSRLRAGAQMSIVHLPESQQRSLLVAHKKGVDEGRRAERRRRGRMDNVGNKTAIHTKYYKQEVPIYQGG